jgi:hypothetical protein
MGVLLMFVVLFVKQVFETVFDSTVIAGFLEKIPYYQLGGLF